MKLITPQLAKRFAEVGLQEIENDPLVIAKFSNPLHKRVYYAVNYYPEFGIILCFVLDLVTGSVHWEDLYLDRLENNRFFGKFTKRDHDFKEVRFSKLRI